MCSLQTGRSGIHKVSAPHVCIPSLFCIIQKQYIGKESERQNLPQSFAEFLFYRVRQKYLTNLQHSCEWNRWRGEFVLKRPSSETQSISVAMELWSVEHRTFAVETYFKNNDSILTQRIFRRHLNIHRNDCP